MGAHAIDLRIVKEYDAKLDNKKRLTIRGAKFEHFKVQVTASGTVILKPQVLVDLDSISENTFKMIEKSVKSLKKGKASKPIDLNKYNFDKED